jgi:hypothetical protein
VGGREISRRLVKNGGVGTISLPNSDVSSGTVTFAAVNTARTVVVLTGMTTSSTLTFDTASDTERNAQADVVLTNGTTITATWMWNNNDSKTQGRVIGYCYVEFR